MLPKSKRLTTEAFKEIIEKGRSFHGPFLIIRALPVQEGSTFAVSVPKKVEKLAVNRNKIRRQVYSIIERLNIKPNFSIVLIIKNGIQKFDFAGLSVEVEQTFVKSCLLK